MIATLGYDVPTVQTWVAKLRKRKEYLEGNPRSDCPATSTTEENSERLYHMVMGDRWLCREYSAQ